MAYRRRTMKLGKGRRARKAHVVRAKAPRFPKVGRNKARGATLKGFRSFTSLV
jgi:hypothetical protein